MKSKLFTTRFHFVDLALSTFVLLEILAVPIIIMVFFTMKPTIGVAILNIITSMVFTWMFVFFRKEYWLDKYKETKRICSEAGKISAIHFIQSVS